MATVTIGVAAALSGCGSSGGNSGGGPACYQLQVLPGWSGFYQACASTDRAYFRLTNTSSWDVLRLQVAAFASVPSLQVGAPEGSDLAVSVERQEFPGEYGGTYAIVPPGTTLTAASADGRPVALTLSIDFGYTAANVTAQGLVHVIGDRLDPAQAAVDSVVGCAQFASSVQDIGQTQPGTPEFWNSFDQAPA